MSGVMNRLWKIRSLGVNVKRMIYEIIVVPSVLYETWGLKERENDTLNSMTIQSLRIKCGVKLIDKIGNEEIRIRVGV